MKVRVFAVVSPTSNIPLNSSNASSAPFRTIRSPERIPCSSVVSTVTVLPDLEIEFVSKVIVVDVEYPRVISVFAPVSKVLPVSAVSYTHLTLPTKA